VRDDGVPGLLEHALHGHLHDRIVVDDQNLRQSRTSIRFQIKTNGQL
jgi:hypothetical protein